MCMITRKVLTGFLSYLTCCLNSKGSQNLVSLVDGIQISILFYDAKICCVFKIVNNQNVCFLTSTQLPTMYSQKCIFCPIFEKYMFNTPKNMWLGTSCVLWDTFADMGV